jgi:hypothetical protein
MDVEEIESILNEIAIHYKGYEFKVSKDRVEADYLDG